jgi:hypothetical protein
MMALLLFAAAAAGPQVGPVEQLKEKVVEAVRNCPKNRAGEVVVCARTPGTPEPYRLPKLDPRFAAVAANGRTVDPDVGATGTGSCSSVGAGGQMGCAKRDYGAWKAERRRKRAAERDYLDPQ